jgi:alpha-N-arabinofuranosidase
LNKTVLKKTLIIGLLIILIIFGIKYTQGECYQVITAANQIKRLKEKGMSIFRRTKHIVMALVAMMAFNGFSENSVTFNVDGATTEIPPGIYGILMERLGRMWTGTGGSGIFVGTSSSIPNSNGMRKDIIEGFKECGITYAQWPGGCAAGAYKWQENKRPANDVGVDRFIEFCRLSGATAFIVGRPQAADAASNLAFCQYVVDSLKYPLKLFKVGNEVWGDCGGKQSLSGYTNSYSTNYDRLKDYATANKIKLVASINYGGDQTWMNSLLQSLPGKIDGFEIHQYMYYSNSISSTDPTDNDYWKIVNESYKNIGDNCKNMSNLLDSKDPQNKVKLVFDEWGDWFKNLGDGWEQRGTLFDALSAAQHLHAFMQYSRRFEMAGLAQAVNVIHAIMNINTSQVMAKTPTFYVLKMFIPHHSDGAKQVPVSAQKWNSVNGNIQAVTAFASVEKSGIVNISFSNVDKSATQAITVTLTSGVESYTVKSAEVITGDAINSFNDFGKSEVVNIKPLASSNYSMSGKTLTVTLPSKSISMIRLLPPGVGVQSGNMIKNVISSFSVKAGANGSVVVSSSVNHQFPVSISVCGIDGRTLVDRVSTRFDNGSICVSGDKSLSNGTYLVKIKGDNINLTKQIVISR